MIKNKQTENLTISEILRTQLLKGSRAPLTCAYLLCAETLLPLITRYLRRQQINFKFSQHLDKQKLLLVISQNFREKKNILPHFVLAYLEELPRCQLFYNYASANATKPDSAIDNSGFLVEYGFQHPLPAVEIVNHLQIETLYFNFADSRRPALVIDPAPDLKSGCDLSKPHALIKKNLYSFSKNQISDAGLLAIKLRLVDDVQTKVAPQALHLQGKELRWLEKICHHLPGHLLGRLRWAGNRKHAIVILPEEGKLSLFPFGAPLKKIKDNLFVPLKQKLSPQLSGPQLEEVLALTPEKITFMTKQWRFDIDEKNFKNFDKMILASVTKSIELNFAELDQPFPFTWLNREENKTAEDHTKDLQTPSNISADQPSQLTISKSIASNIESAETLNREPTPPTETLKEYAFRLRSQNDFLGAATCFALADEPLPAAECYRLAALLLEQQ